MLSGTSQPLAGRESKPCPVPGPLWPSLSTNFRRPRHLTKLTARR
jgi:hypothetical protein